MPKALVIGGGTGLLGQALMRVLLARQWDAETLGRRDGDLLSCDFLNERLRKADADVIFNTAAYTQVDDAEDHEHDARLINHVFPDSLARAIGNLEKGHLVHFSTDFVFSGPHNGPWREDEEPAPQSVYGATKLEGEKAVAAILPDRSCILRVAWLYGPGRKNFVDTIIAAGKRMSTLNVVHDQTGSPTYTLDAADWSVTLGEKRVTGIWHVVNSGNASWCELAAEAVALAAADCKVAPITSDQWPQKAKRPENSALANDKLTAFLGKKPRPWPLALREYIFGEYTQAHA